MTSSHSTGSLFTKIEVAEQSLQYTRSLPRLTDSQFLQYTRNATFLVESLWDFDECADTIVPSSTTAVNELKHNLRILIISI